MVMFQKQWWSRNTVAVVTGANKGLGYETVRLLAQQGLTVVLTARDKAKGQAAVDNLTAEGLESIVFHPLDVCSKESVRTLAVWLERQFGGIDILVNNAGFLSKKFCYETAKVTLDANYWGVRNVTDGLLPLLRASPAGARIVNVSGRLALFERFMGGALKEQFQADDCSVEFLDLLAAQYLEDVKLLELHSGEKSGEWPWVPVDQMPMFSESKIFQNAYTRSLGYSLSRLQPRDHQIFVAAYCPGAARTDMLKIGMEGEDLDTPPDFEIVSATEGADTGVWLALLPKEQMAGKVGKMFGERRELPFGYSGDWLDLMPREVSQRPPMEEADTLVPREDLGGNADRFLLEQNDYALFRWVDPSF